MNWAQLATVSWMLLSLIVAFWKHGDDRGRWDFTDTLCSTLVLFILLWFGGYWK